MSDMWIVLPFLSLLQLSFFYRIKQPRWGWRVAAILAATTLAVASVLFIEAASLFSAVTPFSVRLFWVIACVSLALMIGRRVKRIQSGLFAWPCLGWLEWGSLGILTLIVLINALVAFVAPPNNWDSMTYHLPRVMHWAAQGGVQFYPTHIERQLFNNPGMEYSLLHLYLLSGDDRWFNFVQWFAWVGSAFAVSLIARLLGASSRGQFLAAIFAMTIPMAALQSTSTQNDLYMGFWAAALVMFGLQLHQKVSRTFLYAAGAALGLCVLAKGTFFILAAFMLWFLVRVLSLRNLKHIGCAVCLVLMISAGHYVRAFCWQQGKSFLNAEQEDLMIKERKPGVVVMNGICHLASQLEMPFAPVFRQINALVSAGAMAFKVDLNDRADFPHVFSGPPGPMFVFDEDYASSPGHVLLVLFLPVVLFFIRPFRDVWLYGGCLLAAVLIFIAIIHWQPWCTRLQLPLLILAAPLIGVVYGRWTVGFLAIALLVIVSACLTIVFHQSRPLTGKNRLMQWDRNLYYFMKKPEWVQSFAQATAIIRSSGCRDVGLITAPDSWEYPLWALTGYGEVKYRAVGLPRVSEQPPCLVVTLDTPKDGGLQVAGGIFTKVWEQKPVQIFARTR